MWATVCTFLWFTFLMIVISLGMASSTVGASHDAFFRTFGWVVFAIHTVIVAPSFITLIEAWILESANGVVAFVALVASVIVIESAFIIAALVIEASCLTVAVVAVVVATETGPFFMAFVKAWVHFSCFYFLFLMMTRETSTAFSSALIRAGFWAVWIIHSIAL
jgi:hypothetical protein